MKKVRAVDITKALALKHKDEFFTTECKNGPTRPGYLRFDGVAIYKSWAHPRIVIYEVKTSRSDFLSDSKFYQYLPYCHEMYFVVPKGLIDRSEIPENMGLIYYNPETEKLVTKRKAVYRKITPDPNMLFYIFMNKIDSDRIPFYSDRKEYVRDYIEDKVSSKTLGYKLGTKMARDLASATERLDRVTHLEKDSKLLQDVRRVMRAHDINPYGEDIAIELDKALDKATGTDLSILIKRIELSLDEAKKKHCEKTESL